MLVVGVSIVVVMSLVHFLWPALPISQYSIKIIVSRKKIPYVSFYFLHENHVSNFLKIILCRN